MLSLRQYNIPLSGKKTHNTSGHIPYKHLVLTRKNNLIILNIKPIRCHSP